MFKVGDRVKCINAVGRTSYLIINNIYLVAEVDDDGGLRLKNIDGYHKDTRFVLINRKIKERPLP